MSLIQRFNDELKVALKASNGIKVSVLRMAKAAVKNKEIEKGGELTDDEVVAVLSSMVKQRRESVEQFTKAQRADLAAKEEEEIAILHSYLPQQLSHQELDRIIVDALRESGAKNVQDIGKVMRILMPRVKGAADGKYINKRVRELLESS